MPRAPGLSTNSRSGFAGKTGSGGVGRALRALGQASRRSGPTRNKSTRTNTINPPGGRPAMSSAFDINTVTISGNLTRDPELRSLPSGNSVCNIRIAHNERYKANEGWADRPQYFDVTVWSGLGEYIA